ncbi:DNA-binding domain-containing protein [Fluviicola taffensis]|uniref:DNA-binding domain-containing protein n=1 Tax=Fluviicola taffensis TaxID=191579 RepID=UPI0031378C0A
MSEKTISQIQNWFKTVLVSPGHIPEKIYHAEKNSPLKAYELIKSDERVSAETRLGIYATGYMLRLLECMQADLPSLYAFWGPSLFDMFGRAYILQHPSQSYSLFDLTAAYADFLDLTRPAAEKIDPENRIRYDIPAELVRMERARLSAILSKGTEGKPSIPSLSFFSFFSGSETAIQAHPALQLVIQKMPLVELYRQLMQEQEPVIPEYQTTYLAVSRLNFKIQFYEINDWQFQFLSYLQSQNRLVDLQEAIHYTSLQTLQDKADLLSMICLWLPNAIEMGLVVEA